ncbi:hypothetical protein KSC_028130 [Ktedonobacter sp. SOSP1-52]|uniref:hypothetical protein n=1 Tax=Ktedonobacter sp. SOSP1-52 TaxID=2778366 RepID=UPI0019162728|nr:hypothetical protein [Ktedonobacter sp. SOSP1-52]GHO63921.1 hypothetical protein KSC_028130 [Ktedonobacter sp. SOSP1-52]
MKFAIQQKKKHAFYNFPSRFLLNTRASDALAILSHASKQFEALPRSQRHIPSFQAFTSTPSTQTVSLPSATE